MKSAAPAAEPEGRSIQTANQRWKAGWSAWVLRSMIVAAAAHAVLFGVWPNWSISHVRPDPEVRVVQIKPMEGAGVLLEEEEELPTTTLPRIDPVVEDPGGGGVDMDEIELADLMLRLSDLEPRVMYPVLGATAYGRPAPPLASLNLDEFEVVQVDLGGLPTSLIWPLIRNPGGVARHLSSAGAVPRRPPFDGTVTVAVRINERGSVEWAQVSQSSGQPTLDAIALAAFHDVAVFRPARNAGHAVPLSVLITILFDSR